MFFSEMHASKYQHWALFICPVYWSNHKHSSAVLEKVIVARVSSCLFIALSAYELHHTGS